MHLLLSCCFPSSFKKYLILFLIYFLFSLLRTGLFRKHRLAAMNKWNLDRSLCLVQLSPLVSCPSQSCFRSQSVQGGLGGYSHPSVYLLHVVVKRNSSQIKKTDYYLKILFWITTPHEFSKPMKQLYSLMPENLWDVLFRSFFFIYIFIYLAVLSLSCGMWDLAPWIGIEPRPAALGAES